MNKKYLPIVSLVGFCLFLVFILKSCIFSEYDVNSDLLQLHNEARLHYGARELKIDSKLSKAALMHSKWMDKNDRMDHEEDSSKTREPWDRVRVAGGQFGMVGENIAWGTDNPRDTFTMWMNSKGHRANILNKGYRYAGFAKVGTYWTAVFAAE